MHVKTREQEVLKLLCITPRQLCLMARHPRLTQRHDRCSSRQKVFVAEIRTMKCHMNAFGFASFKGPSLIKKLVCDIEYYNTK